MVQTKDNDTPAPSGNAPLLHAIMRVLIGVWVVLLVLSLLPLTANPAGPVKRLVTDWAVLLMALVWLGVVLFRRAPLRLTPLAGILAAFVAVHLLACTVSSVLPRSLAEVRYWSTLTLVAFFAAQAYREPRQVWRMMTVLVIAVGLSSIYGFCQRYGYDPFPWSGRDIEEYKGLPSTYANPNFAGHALVLAILMTGGLVVRHWRARKAPLDPNTMAAAFFGFLTALMGLHLYLTHMRGGRLALVAAFLFLGVFWLVRRRFQKPLRAALATCLIMVLLGGAGLAGVAGVLRAYGQDSALPLDGSLVLRFNGYHGAGRMVLDRPALGFGPGNYAAQNAAYWTSFEQQWYAMKGKKNMHVHCDVLESAADAGLPGAGLYLALIAWGILTGLVLAGSSADSERRSLGYILAACCVAFAVDGLFGFNSRVEVSAGFFFLLLGALSGLSTPSATFRRWMVPVQLGLVAVALVCVFFQCRDFTAELFYQRGQGGEFWANEYKKEGEAQRDNLTERKKFTKLEEFALRDTYAAYERGRDLRSWDVRFHESLGDVALKQKRVAEATDHFEDALRYQPNSPGLRISLAQVHINQAIPYVQPASEGDPTAREELDTHLAEAERQAGQALAICHVLSEGHEARGRAAFLQAVVRAQQREDATAEWRMAEESFQQALRHGTPARGAIQRMLGQVYLNRARPDEAEQALERAAESDPENMETWRLFDVFARRFEREAVFIDALSHNLGRLRATKPIPADAVAEISWYLARLYGQSEKNRALGEAVLLDALVLTPDRTALWGALALLPPEEGRLMRLQKHLEGKSIKVPLLRSLRDLDSASAREWLEFLTKAGGLVSGLAKEQPSEQVARNAGWIASLAAGEIPGLSATEEERGKMLAWIGRIHAASAAWDEAERCFAQAAAALPAKEALPCMVNRSEALAALERSDEALALAREVARLAPANPSVRWNLARRLTAAARYAEAKFEYMTLIQQVPANSPSSKGLHAELQAVEQALAQQKKAPQS